MSQASSSSLDAQHRRPATTSCYLVVLLLALALISSSWSAEGKPLSSTRKHRRSRDNGPSSAAVAAALAEDVKDVSNARHHFTRASNNAATFNFNEDNSSGRLKADTYDKRRFRRSTPVVSLVSIEETNNGSPPAADLQKTQMTSRELLNDNFDGFNNLDNSFDLEYGPTKRSSVASSSDVVDTTTTALTDENDYGDITAWLPMLDDDYTEDVDGYDDAESGGEEEPELGSDIYEELRYRRLFQKRGSAGNGMEDGLKSLESDGSSSQRGGGGSVGILGLDNLDYTVTMLELRRQREENSQSTSPDTTSVTQQVVAADGGVLNAGQRQRARDGSMATNDDIPGSTRVTSTISSSSSSSTNKIKLTTGQTLNLGPRHRDRAPPPPGSRKLPKNSRVLPSSVNFARLRELLQQLEEAGR